MDIAFTPATLASAAAGFDRLVAAVAAAEGAFRRLVAGQGGGGLDRLDDAVALERERRRLIGESNEAYRDQGALIGEAAAEQEAAARRAGVVWAGFGDRLTETFQGLFERIVRDGKLRFADLFDTLGPLVADLLGRITGLDLSPVLGAVSKVLNGGAGGSIGGLIGQLGGLLGPLLGGSGGGSGGGLGSALGSLFGGSGGLGSVLSLGSSLFGSLLGGGGLGGLFGSAAGALGALLPIPGVNVIAAALPLVAGFFEDKDYPFAKAGIGAVGGKLASDPFGLDDGPVGEIARLGEQVAATLQDVFDRLGARVGDLADLTAIGYSSGRKAVLPEGFFAGIDAGHGADFATGAVFAGLDDPEEAVLRAVQTGLLRALETSAARGVDPDRADTVAIGLRRAIAADFTTLEDGLADVAFLRDFGRTVERLKAAGDPAALQRLDLRDRAETQGADDAERIRGFLERAGRLFAPLDPAVPDEDPVAEAASLAERRPVTDEGTVVGYADPDPTTAEPGSTIIELPSSDDGLAAERLAAARTAVDDYVRALLGIAEAAGDTAPLTGYALQLAEAETRLDGLSAALREAGYSAEEAAALIDQGKDAARDRLREAYEGDVARDLRAATGLGAIDRVGDLVGAHETRRSEGEALGADVTGLDELLRLQVEALVSAGSLSIAALDALRVEFADNAVVSDALAQALSVQTAAANDNVAAQLTLADVTRLATRELDAQIREQEAVKRSAEAVVEAIADTRRRLNLDPALSVLSPAEQLEQARQRFEDLAGRSQAGDQAAQAELPEAGETYLELAREFYASNEDYARIFGQVDATLRATGDVADRQLQVAEAQLEELRELRRAVTGEVGELPNPDADFGRNPTRNRILARLTGYAGDFGNGGFDAFRPGLSPGIAALVDAIASSVNFAGGGVMTPGGPLELHRYAHGGIAVRPQLALFGEARMPEAFVPLPDGRTIPVTVSAPANDSAARAPDRRHRGAGRGDPPAARRHRRAARRERYAAPVARAAGGRYGCGEGGMSRFDDLLSDAYAGRRYLVVVEPFDPALGATRTLRFSGHGFVTAPGDDPPNAWYEPRLVTALNFERQLFSGGRLQGRSVPGFGALTLNNADGGLDGLAALAWDGRRVRVWLGGDGFALAEFGLVFDGTADQVEFDDLLLTVRLRDLQARFEAEIARATYAGTGGTEGREGLAGRPRPLCFGRALRVPAVLVDPAALLYQVHDGPIAEVDAVYDRGLPLTKVAGVPAAGQFRSDPATGCFTLGASPAGTVTADVRGDAPDGPGDGYVETAAGLVRRLATARAGFADPADLDLDAFAAFDAVAPAPVGMFVADETPLAELLDALVDAVGGHYGFDRAGRLTVGRLDPPATAADAEFDAVQILEIERVAVGRPLWRQKLGFGRYWRTLDPGAVAGAVDDGTRADLAEGFRYASAEDAAVRTRHLLAEEAVHDTALAFAADAQAEAARRLVLFGADRDAFRVRLKVQPFALELGRTVRIRYPRYGLAAGRNLLVVGMVEDAAVNEVTLDLWG